MSAQLDARSSRPADVPCLPFAAPRRGTRRKSAIAGVARLLTPGLAVAQKPTVEPGTCGTTRPELKGIGTAEGLVIAPDGTIYFTQPFDKGASSFLGRYRA